MKYEAPSLSGKALVNYNKFSDFIRKIGSQRPTTRQYLFVEAYLDGMSGENAYKAAGYCDISKLYTCQRYSLIRSMIDSPGIQYLMKAALFNWARKREVTANVIADRLLNIVDTADNVKDQLAALKELNLMLGFHNTLNLRKLKYRSALLRKAEKHAA